MTKSVCIINFRALLISFCSTMVYKGNTSPSRTYPRDENALGIWGQIIYICALHKKIPKKDTRLSARFELV